MMVCIMAPDVLCELCIHSTNSLVPSGEWKANIDIPRDASLKDSVMHLDGEEKEAFLTFIRGMLQWRPEDRKTAAQLYHDPWLRS